MRFTFPIVFGPTKNVTSSLNASSGADAKMGHIAGGGDGEGELAGFALEEEGVFLDVLELGVEVGEGEVLAFGLGSGGAFDHDRPFGHSGVEGDAVLALGERRKGALGVLDDVGDFQRVEAGAGAFEGEG